MGFINHNWLNAQEARRYPLDDNANGTGDDGKRMKDDAIVDLHIRWPRLAGQYAFLGGLTITPTIVTVVILAADSPTATSNFTPLAAVTIEQPATEYSYYNFEPLYPGVGGFIAFGDVEEAFNIRFSTPQQGLLSPKVGRPYDNLPIPSMRKFGRVDGLTGLVKLLPGHDIEIVKESVNVGGTTTDAVVIRLQSPTSARNAVADYIGPCGKRPESNNCDRTGIQTINGVTPDCNGNIEIEFRNLHALNYKTCGSAAAGVTLDQSYGIDEVCADKAPDRFKGSDACNPETSSSVSLPSEPSESLPSDSLPSLSSESIPCTDLPFKDCFDTIIHHSWWLKQGLYKLVTADSPKEDCLIPRMCSSVQSLFSSSSFSDGSEMSLALMPWEITSSFSCPYNIDQAVQLYDTSKRNVLIWDDCGTGSSIGKHVTTQVQLRNTGTQQNAGIVLNYQLVDPFTNPRITYWVAQINRTTNRVELQRFNGTNLILENSAAPSIPFSLNNWYQIEVTTAAAGASVIITVRVTNSSDPSWPAVSFSLVTTRWGSDDGRFGIHTTKAVSNFSFWEIEDA